MREVGRLKPVGVLDLGIGVGKYGMLCRELLDGLHGRFQPEDWRTNISGVEAFEGYRNPAWELYNRVFIGDFVDYYRQAVDWPLVMMIDSLEHVEETAGQAILRYLVENNQNVIVSVPVGNYPQGAVHGNAYEKHRTTFFGSEFDQYHHTILHQDICKVVSIKGAKS